MEKFDDKDLKNSRELEDEADYGEEN